MAATAMPIPLVAILGVLKFRSWYIGSSSTTPDAKGSSPQLDGFVVVSNGNGALGRTHAKEPRLLSVSDKSETVESFLKPSASNGSYAAVCKDDPDVEASSNGIAMKH